MQLVPIYATNIIINLLVIIVATARLHLDRTRLLWAVPGLMWAVHAIIFATVFLIDWQDRQIDAPTYAMWGAGLQFHGYLTALLVETAKWIRQVRAKKYDHRHSASSSSH